MTDTINGKQQFTAFCQERGKTGGTTWISCVWAESLGDALIEAAELCAQEWGCDPEDVHVLGLAEGDVKILHWDDQE